MTTPRLNLLVLRSMDPPRTVSFYELLSLRFQQEQHEIGPVHWAAETNGLVIEIYPAKSVSNVDSTTRLGFEVDDVESIRYALYDSDKYLFSHVKQTEWGLQVIAKDPDGRSVVLVQTN